jgi:sec-independent protein translocase protein TatA
MSTNSAILGVLGIGGSELWLILVIVLVLFGGAKLPSLARGLGQSIKEFKKAQKDDDEVKPTDAKVEAAKKADSTPPSSH